MATRRDHPGRPSAEDVRALHRVRRNFWVLVTATTVAVGVLSIAVQQPPGVGTGILTLVAGLAALAGITLAGRILVVTARGRRSRR
jgi:FtsH-binding integral membrane protein